MKRLVVCATVTSLLLISPAQAATPRERLFRWVNHARVIRGLPALRLSWRASQLATNHSERMASAARIWHTVKLKEKLRRLGVRFTDATDIVGATPIGHLYELFTAFMASPAHRSVILGRWNRVGIGTARAHGSVWATLIFVR